MAFSAKEFTFDGESSAMYGLVLCQFGESGQDDVAFGNQAEIVETRTTGRVTPIHLGVNYNKSPLQFKLVFAAEEPLDRQDLERISMWLTGHQQYKWLTIDQPDMVKYQYRCIITNLKPIGYRGRPHAMEATVTCDCPYAYSLPYHLECAVSGSKTVTIKNTGTAREYVKPEMVFEPNTGNGILRITNASDGGRVFELTGLPAGVRVHIDNTNGIIYGEGSSHNYYDGFNLNFLRLVRGENQLNIEGRGTLGLSCRFLHNVAG